MNQALDERVQLLEETVRNLREELEGYKALFAAAATSPTGKQVLRMLGIEPARLNPGGRV